MASFTVYADDSGTHGDSPIAISACWISQTKRWRLFDRYWARLQAKHGFSCLHTSELVAANPKTEFALWDDQKCSGLIRDARLLIRKRAAKGLGIAIIKRDFEELVPESLKAISCRTHYGWAVIHLFGMIEKWRKETGLDNADNPVEYVFDWIDRQKPERREIEMIFERFENAESAWIKYGMHKGCLSFRRRQEVSPLQAADFLAWLLFCRARSWVSGKSPKPIAVESWDDFAHPDARQSHLVEAGLIEREQLKNWVEVEMAERRDV